MSRHHHDENHEDTIIEEIEVLPSFPMRIFEGDWEKNHPIGFDAITIPLNGTIQSDLNWNQSREQAQKAISLGFKIMWNLDLGLFDRLSFNLTNQSQFLSLTLALEHFRDNFWKEFKSDTIGISLYRGSADFSRSFSWDEVQRENLHHWLNDIQQFDLAKLSQIDLSQLTQTEWGGHWIRLFCRDVAIEYLSLLASRLPDALPVYLFLDASPFPASLGMELQALNPERFDRFHLSLKGVHLPFNAIGWGVPTPLGYSGHSLTDLPLSGDLTIGICVPPLNIYELNAYEELEGGLKVLMDHSIPFKIIPECHLTSQWDGLDVLLFSPAGLSPQGRRKLQGFSAAGGRIIESSLKNAGQLLKNI